MIDHGDPLRVGLIGYGLAGAAFHAPLLRAVGMRVATVVTRSAERSALARQKDPGVRVVDSADELWTMRDGLDLVVVASPNRTHVPLARAAIRAGLPVVVDKPLAASAAEADELVQEARSLGVLLSVFQNRRWDGDFLTLRRLMTDGELGEVHRFESHFERWRPELRGGWRERGDPEEAGGVLFDLGSHLIDQARVLFGPVHRVSAEIRTLRPGADADDDVFLAMEHRGGTLSHLWMSLISPHPQPRLRLLGSRAGYIKDGTDVQEAALRAGREAGGPDWGREPEDAWGVVGAEDRWRPVPTLPGNYPAYYAGIERAIRGGGALPVEPEDAVAVLRVIEAARDSAAEGRRVDVVRG